MSIFDTIDADSTRLTNRFFERNGYINPNDDTDVILRKSIGFTPQGEPDMTVVTDPRRNSGFVITFQTIRHTKRHIFSPDEEVYDLEVCAYWNSFFTGDPTIFFLKEVKNLKVVLDYTAACMKISQGFIDAFNELNCYSIAPDDLKHKLADYIE